jgi:acetyl-CoA C-acetyltransferase
MTLTGGLMYNGGPGANTAMHGLAALVPRLRAAPGEYGLVYANGGMMTKHSVGVYSTTPYAEAHAGAAWQREDPHATQRLIDALPAAAVAAAPAGRGEVETYTVLHAGAAPALICVIGTLLDGPDAGKRFIANMAVTEANLRLAFVDDLLGRVGAVAPALLPAGARPQDVPGATFEVITEAPAKL